MEEAKKCMIIAAGPVESKKIFDEFNPTDYYVICADAGYETAIKYNIKPDCIVGDFDSAKTMPSATKYNVKKLPVEKDYTDTMYAAVVGYKMGCRDFIIVGGIGGKRLDHMFANYNVMLYLARSGCTVLMADNTVKMFLLAGRRLRINNQKGAGVSVFPFGLSSCNLTYKGLKYPLQGEDLVIGDTLMGVSNEVTEANAEIMVHAGYALVMLYPVNDTKS